MVKEQSTGLVSTVCEGVSEKIEKTCKDIGSTKLKVVFKPFRTMRQMLMKVKTQY